MTVTPLEILPHPHSADQRIFPLGIQSRAADGAGDKPIVTVLGTDGTEDRHGSVINPRGWDTESYLRNPVVLWGHEQQRWPAIGRTVALRRSGGGWEFDIEFAVEQWRHMGDNIAATVYEMMRDGFLNAVSVSFIPKEWREREASTIPSFFAENVEYVRQELTEISVVNVGSNRNALKKALAAGKLNEQQARSLGLDAMLRLDIPYELQTQPDAKRASMAEFRAQLRSIVDRCYACYSPQQEQVSPEVADAEKGIINELAGGLLDELETALRGWKIAEHEELRELCSSLVSADMYLFDRLGRMLEIWYEEEVGATVPSLSMADMEAVVENASPSTVVQRAGAVLNSKNRDRVAQIMALAQGILEDAGLVDDEEERVQPPTNAIRILSSEESPRQRDTTSLIRIKSAEDADDGRSPDRSTPDIYRIMLK